VDLAETLEELLTQVDLEEAEEEFLVVQDQEEQEILHHLPPHKEILEEILLGPHLLQVMEVVEAVVQVVLEQMELILPVE
jgi:5'(3')-deoxyribonucleotidase